LTHKRKAAAIAIVRNGFIVSSRVVNHRSAYFLLLKTDLGAHSLACDLAATFRLQQSRQLKDEN